MDELEPTQPHAVDRRTALKRGGTVAALGIWTIPAVQTVARPAFAGGSPPVVALPRNELRAVTFPPVGADLRSYRVDANAAGGGIIFNTGSATTTVGRSRVIEVPGIVQPTDGTPSAPTTSFQEVDATGLPTLPARYLRYLPGGGPASSTLQLQSAPLPTDPAAAAAFRRDASFVRRAPNAAGEGERVSFESLTVPGSFIRHTGFILRVQPLENVALFLQDSTFRRVLFPAP